MNYEYKEEHHLHDLSVCHSDIVYNYQEKLSDTLAGHSQA